MAKRAALGVPGWVWGAGIVALLALIANEKLKNPRCKKCDDALKLINATAGYACPTCGTVATVTEVLLGLA